MNPELSLFRTFAFVAVSFASGVSSAQDVVRSPFGTGEMPEFLRPYDLDCDGKLSTEERQAFEVAYREAAKATVTKRIPWDTDGDGKLSDAEKAHARASVAVKVAENRTKRFREIDNDGDGFLSVAEAQKIPGCDEKSAKRMIANLDKETPRDGRVSLAEFLGRLKPLESSDK